MSTKTWTDISEQGSRFASFQKTHTIQGVEYLYLLEEVNKTWDLPHNWTLSVFEPDLDSVSGWVELPTWQDKFYLNVHHNTSQQAQHLSDTTLTVEIVEALNG